MTQVTETLLINLIVIAVAMIALWLVASVRRDASVVDPFWGLGFVALTWVSLRINPPAGLRSQLLCGLTTIWGLRLALFLLWRNWGQGEDRRYAAMRAHHGHRFVWISLFSVFLLQGAILWFVSFPIQVALARDVPTRLGWLDVFGIIIWAVGISFEAVGDWQLARFQARPENAGRVMDRGLWRFTRHPNYFGDFCVWWGLYLIGAVGGAGWTFMSPLLMSILLMKVSGVTLLESTIIDRRPEYAAYKTRTNAFFPGLPRVSRRTSGK